MFTASNNIFNIYIYIHTHILTYSFVRSYSNFGLLMVFWQLFSFRRVLYFIFIIRGIRLGFSSKCPVICSTSNLLLVTCGLLEA